MPIAQCVCCNNEFYAKQSHLKRGWGKYCSIACRSRAQIRGKYISCFICNREIYRTNADIKKSKSGKYFCSKRCQTIWRNSILYIGESHSNWIDGESAYRRILEAAKPEKACVMCTMHDERVIIVHHLDKNRKNNDVANLIWLCNNCHYLVHHYKKEQKRLYSIIGK